MKTLVNCFMPAIYDGEPGALGLALTIFLQGKNLEILHHVKKKLEMVVLLGRSTALGGRGGGGRISAARKVLKFISLHKFNHNRVL